MSDDMAQAATPIAQAANNMTQAVTPEPKTGEGKEQSTTEQARSPWTPEAAEAKIKELNAEAYKWRKQWERAEKAKAEAEQATLAEQGKFEELYKKEHARAAELEQAVKARDLALLRQRVATVKKLPQPLADRLRGETQEELEADADALLAALPRPVAPGLDGRAGGGRGDIGATVTDEEVQSFATRMGISAQHVDRAALAKSMRR